jgi:hypothetical protein
MVCRHNFQAARSLNIGRYDSPPGWATQRVRTSAPRMS